jgi:hypothetical protein
MKKNHYLFTAILLTAIAFIGCKKEIITATTANTAKISSTSNTKLVFFPRVGWVSADKVHLIEAGNYVTLRNGHYLKMEKGTDKLIEDFGDFRVKQTGLPPNPPLRAIVHNASSLINKKQASIPYGENPNWITFAESPISSSTGTVNYFSTTWVVPNLPATDGQQLYIYNGLMDSNQVDILQPVLQWGTQTFTGGDWWAVTNAYAASATAHLLEFYAYTPPVRVNPGDTIQGVMNFTGIDIYNSYTYTSTFYKIENGVPTNLNNMLTLKDNVTKWGANEFIKNQDSIAPSIPQLNIPCETLEAYGADGIGYVPTVVTDYPSNSFVAMKGINITTIKTNVTSTPALSWSATNQVTNFGQYTDVVNDINNSSPGGEVDIYFHPNIPPPITDIAEIDCTVIDTAVYWLKNGTVSSGTSTNATAFRSPRSYTLPSGETPSDIVGIGVSSSNKVYYYYLDGTFSVGSSTNATSFQAPESYTVAAGETISNILGISVDKSTNYVYTWYKDGTISQGNSLNLGLHNPNYGTFTVAAGESISTVVGIGIAGNTGYCHVWYSDQTTSTGTLTQFDYYSPAVPCTL